MSKTIIFLKNNGYDQYPNLHGFRSVPLQYWTKCSLDQLVQVKHIVKSRFLIVITF